MSNKKEPDGYILAMWDKNTKSPLHSKTQTGKEKALILMLSAKTFFKWNTIAVWKIYLKNK